MRKCLDLGNIDTLIVFANSPHWSQTSTGQASGSLMMHTCNLPKANYRKFADYFLTATQRLIDEGFPVKYVSTIDCSFTETSLGRTTASVILLIHVLLP